MMTYDWVSFTALLHQEPPPRSMHVESKQFTYIQLSPAKMIIFAVRIEEQYYR